MSEEQKCPYLCKRQTECKILWELYKNECVVIVTDYTICPIYKLKVENERLKSVMLQVAAWLVKNCGEDRYSEFAKFTRRIQ